MVFLYILFVRGKKINQTLLTFRKFYGIIEVWKVVVEVRNEDKVESLIMSIPQFIESNNVLSCCLLIIHPKIGTFKPIFPVV
jgi:hypothetical protein